MNANGIFSSLRLKLMRPESTSRRVKRTPGCDGGREAFGLGDAEDNAATDGRGNHSARFQSPAELRTRFRLGLVSETVPSSICPRSKLCQRSRTVTDSARRKYSWPKRGSSAKVTGWASSVGPPQRLKS